MPDRSYGRGTADPNKVRIEQLGSVAVIVVDNPPVNAGSAAVRRGLLNAVHKVAIDTSIESAVIIGAGSTFIAGSDMTEFGKPLLPSELPTVLSAIEECSKPIVAAIHGAALGGGFELALACDARVASNGAVVGLPEVTLGMIPGAGGTQRLPRLTGVVFALEMICSGRRVGALEAMHSGIIDTLVEGDLRTGAIEFARQLRGRKRSAADLPIPVTPMGELDKVIEVAIYAGRGRANVAAAIEIIKSVRTDSFVQGLAREREVFERLRVSDEAVALRYLFFAEREAAKIPGISGTAPKSVRQIAVIGTGAMGTGIAMCLLSNGYNVTLVDKDEESLGRGEIIIQQSFEQKIGSGRWTAEESTRRFSAFSKTTDISSLIDVDVAIEATFEDMVMKLDLFRTLDATLKPGALIASTTFSLNLDKLAEATTRPRDVVGLHFLIPAQTSKLLEVVRGAATSAESLATALAIAKKLRKIVIVARVGEGFIGHRIYSAYRRQCEFLLEEGTHPEEVDAALVAFGMTTGPFSAGDMSGLDVDWKARQRVASTLPLGSQNVSILDHSSELKRHGRAPEEIVRRAMAAMINETALLLEEGVAIRASDADVAMVSGYGFPSFRGGPIHWANRHGANWIVDQVHHLACVSGSGFRQASSAALSRLSDTS
jgi:3-hydroxyacyl-CoA dehydrogenase